MPLSTLQDLTITTTGSQIISALHGIEYLTEQWHGFNNTLLRGITSDLVLVDELFNATRPIRLEVSQKYDFINLTDYEIHYNSSFNYAQFNLFRALSETQRKTLDHLMTVQSRIYDNIVRDATCFPQLTDCLEALEDNCLETFLYCQNDLPESLSFYEVHACLQERAHAHLFNKDLLDQLCLNPTKVKDDITQFNVSQEEPQRQMKETGDSSSGMFVQEDSLLSVAAYSGLNSAAYSFIDTTVTSYVEHWDLSRPAVRVLLANLTYVSLVGAVSYFYSDEENASFKLQVVLPVTLTLFNKTLDNIKGHTLTKHVLTAITFTAQAMTSTTGKILTSLASGMVGSLAGTLLGRSMSRWMGRKAPQETSFRPTKSIINEKVCAIPHAVTPRLENRK